MKKILLQHRSYPGVFSKTVHKTKNGIEKKYKCINLEKRKWIEPVFKNYQMYFPYIFTYELGVDSCNIKQTFLKSNVSVGEFDFYKYIDLSKNLLMDIQKDKTRFWALLDIRLNTNIFFIDNRFVLIDESKLVPYQDITLAKLTTTQGFYQGLQGPVNLKNIDYKKVNEKIVETVEEVYSV